MRRFSGLCLLALAVCVVAKAQTVSCSSDDGSKKYCVADTKQGVQLAKQRSDAPCKQGVSWGFDDRGIWVDRGCGGEFTLGVAAPAASTEAAGKVFSCASDGGKKYCDVSTGGGVRLLKQKSGAACKQGSTWGYDGLGIWVDQGCSADFVIGGKAVAPVETHGEAPSSDGGDGNADKTAKDRTCLKTAGKARADQLVKECLKVSAATHPPCSSQNSCELIVDEIRRSCVVLGLDAPSFCGGYLK
jgi:DUF3011 family protein